MLLAVAAIAVSYVAPARGIGAPADHVTAIRAVMARVDRLIELPHPLRIEFRDCGTANAYFRPESGTLEICHELWDERRALYITTGHDREAIERELRGAMTYTVFHEFGHALHRELGLPLVGGIESAADELGTLWMIRVGLAEAAAAAARGHYLRAHQPGYTHDPFDAHGSGTQRAFAIGCVLQGADRRFASVLDGFGVSAARRSECVSDYPRRVEAWISLHRGRLRGLEHGLLRE